MARLFDFSLDDTDDIVTESYDPGTSSFKDLFDEKFTSFNPEAIVSGGNNRLQSGMFDLEIEDSDLAIGYKNAGPATSPKIGRWS
jgi:hypothetical protein